jgi:hypothetical protein
MEFKNVTVIAKANVYDNGKVTSRTLLFPDGSKKTLGVMLPGRYRFSTSLSELMEILGGEARLLVQGAADWVEVQAGKSFRVEANSFFEIDVTQLLDYCCSYGV